VLTRPYWWACVFLAVLMLAVLYWAVTDTLRATARDESAAMAQDIVKGLRIGMTRAEAEQAADRYAIWYRCGFADVYVIGSSDVDRASVLYLRYNHDAAQTLEQIASLDRDRLFQFSYCAVYRK
jgi:hypothetical protein